MSTAITWIGVVSIVLWCGVIVSVIIDPPSKRPPAPPRGSWYVVVRSLPDASGVRLLVCRPPNEMVVGSVDAGDERFDEHLAELRGAAEERAAALNAVA